MSSPFDNLSAALAGRYTIERELGGGGMSRVFLATELTLDREVVIKVLPAEMAGQVSLERFNREIGLAARLQHAHIVPLLSAGELDGLPYFTMPYVAGESLRARLTKGGELPLNEAIRLLREVASALAYAHAHGVVHRDIKPENILLSGGAAMVTDFGVAKAVSESTGSGASGLTSLGVALGTPAYMAPEQASADPMVDSRADIYAWGVMAYELLTGQSPFAGRSPQAMLAAHISEAPELITRRRAAVPTALAQIVMRSLEKRAADRPQSADDLLRVLDSLVTPGSGTMPALAQAGSVPVARTMRRVALATAGIAVITAGGWWAAHRTAAGTGGPRSVAVLPFENAGGDSTQEYFSDGMSDDIASALVNEGVHVAPRISSTAFKGRHAAAHDVGSTLGVDAVLTGSVRRLGDRLHVTVELTDAKAGVVLGSYSRDSETKDLFAVQRAITDSILGVMRTSLGRSTTRAIPVHADDPAAHDLVLRGRHALDAGTRASFYQAIAMFNRALEIDPKSVNAYVGLGFGWTELCDAFIPPIDCYPKGLIAAQRALELDSTSSEAQSLMAAMDVQYVWDWPAAQRRRDRAMALNPRDPTALLNQSMYARIFESHTDALAPMREAAHVDPLNPLYELTLEWAYLFDGQLDSTIATARHLEQISPGFVYADAFSGYAFGKAKRFAEADSVFNAAEPLVGHRSAGLAWLRAVEGKPGEARAILAEIERDWKTKYVVPELIAWAYQALGDKEKMLEWLEKGVDVHSAMAAYGTSWPELAQYRDEPRLRALRKRMNLPEVAPR